MSGALSDRLERSLDTHHPCTRPRSLAPLPGGISSETFEHIYRHHRRYRITEGSDELQMRRIAARLFGLGRGG